MNGSLLISFKSMIAMIGVGMASTAMAQSPTGIQTEWKPQHQNIRFVRAQQNFEQVRRILLREAYGRSVNEAKLFEAATQGMIRSLNNGQHQWNELLSPQEVNRLKSNLNGQFTGIGIEIDFISGNGTALIKRVLQDSPADLNGLMPGDQILTVNDKKFKGKSLPDMVNEIRGPIGEKVAIKILRDTEVVDKEFVRAKINMTSVKANTDRPQIGYLKIKYFNRETPKLIQQKLVEFKEKKVKGIVLDLRRNFGGILGGAVATADFFIPKGNVIAKINGRDNFKMVMKSKSDPSVNVPVVVLVNKETSSGAELLASALKDNLKIKIVGQNTYGKWNAQSIRHLPNNFAVKYTIYEFRSPNDKSYHEVGLTPDVIVANPKAVFNKDNAANTQNDKQLETAYNLINTMI